MALRPADSATWAAGIVSPVVPYSLENRTRICFPPIDTCTICRNVESVKAGAGGALLVSPCWGEVAQVPTQWGALFLATALTLITSKSIDVKMTSCFFKKPPLQTNLFLYQELK